ncbi:DJ-1/PfpI family protein [Actinocorallia longicatena]|uniref:DJ-1/PfpI family protein n=1 Tax=Actinocorallia longicatena TaxID=111803 RepID=A0ABP6QC99_9ACTN
MRIVFPLYPGFTSLDVIGPYEVLSRLPEAEAVFAAVRPGPVTGEGGVTVTATHALADLTEADIIVVPGGPGTREAVSDAAYVAWLKAIDATTTWTTSVCGGSLLLGAAGLLTGLEATSHWTAADLLPVFGATFTLQRVVFQGKVVTAAGVSSGIDMALALFARIEGDDAAQTVQLHIEYDPQPPFDHGSPAKATPDQIQRVRKLVMG